MATTQSVLDRVRLEISDSATPFISQIAGDGTTRVFDLPSAPISATGLLVTVDGNATTAYTADLKNATLTFTTAPTLSAAVEVTGTGYRFFTDVEIGGYIDTAFSQHAHGRAIDLARLPSVEDYLLVLLASIEALYALLNDATFDIDVNTPEGGSVPRHQRWQQLMQMIELREKQYNELAAALNVGLFRVEQFTLRRVSRTTGRLVPVFVAREIEDTSPPRRVFPAIDLQGADPVLDPVLPTDITLEQGVPFSLSTVLGQDITGKTVSAQIRRYDQGAPLLYFNVTVTDLATGAVTIDMSDTSRYRVFFDGDLFWDLRVTDPASSAYPHAFHTLRRGRVLIIERPRI